VKRKALLGESPGAPITNDLKAGVTAMADLINLSSVFNSLLYSVLGIVVFWVSFIIVDKITPYDLWREIVEERNTALAIVIAATALGISIIVAAAIHG